VAVRFRSRALTALRSVVDDALYRGSMILITNMVATSAIGFVFWALATHRYPPSTVGVFSSVTSGVGLLATIAALGLPNTLIRRLASAENPRGLVIAAVSAIAVVGTILCLVTVLALGPHLPPELHLRQRGPMLFLVTGLVSVAAVSGTIDSGLVATRSSHALLIKNVLGSIVKIVAIFLLVSFRSSGLLISYGLGLAVATGLGALALGRRLGKRKGAGPNSFHVLRSYLSITTGNYLATIMGMLPVSIVPIEVFVVRGPVQTARFAVAFLIAGLLNFIPSTVAQVLFAEASRQGATLGQQLRKALRAVYGLLLAPVIIIIATAPLLLRLFGTGYAGAATNCLRVLALSALLTGGTYLVDSLLIARDRIGAYIFINGANAALVLSCVGVLLPRGLTAAAGGWALAQSLSLLLGLILLATGRLGRHHLMGASSPSEAAHPDLQPQPADDVFEPQIRELLATWPMMPTTLIAETVGWDRPIGLLLDQVTELRPTYFDPHEYRNSRYPPGQIAQCGFWFPPVEIPVGFDQSRSARELPVLTLIIGYSRWLSAMLIPTTYAQDMLAGLWNMLAGLGAVPHVLKWTSDGGPERGRPVRAEFRHEFRDFCRYLGAEFVEDRSTHPKGTGLIQLAHADLEHAFLTGRTFASPADFNVQLCNWLDLYNARNRRPPNRPPAQLISTDRQAMLQLPAQPPLIGWRASLNVGSRAFVRFDSNYYSLHPAVTGRRIKLFADLRHIKVLCDGKVAADHDRVWARDRTIRDPAHAAVAKIAAPRLP
jgi:O-antigen/teichoic acid export membrane protein